jgi:hypothetical protein
VNNNCLTPLYELGRYAGAAMGRVAIYDATVVVDVINDKGQPKALRFFPYQAVRVTTEDCFDLPCEWCVFQDTIMEIKDSEWINSLKTSLAVSDHAATFLDRSRHFVVRANNDFVEVVAWEVSIT